VAITRRGRLGEGKEDERGVRVGRTRSCLGVGRAIPSGRGPFFLALYPTGSFLNDALINSSASSENFPPPGSCGGGSLTMFCRSSRMLICPLLPASETPDLRFVDVVEVFLDRGGRVERRDSRFAARCFSASMMLSRFFSGLAGERVSSPRSSRMSSASPSSSTPARERREKASSSSVEGSSSLEKGKRPMASSTREMPRDQTSDLTV
jgi:hypothetical protein